MSFDVGDHFLPRFSHLISLAFLVLLSPATRGGDVDFSRDIRPILSNHCFTCHGPDADTREADLRLDQPSAVIVPGKAAASDLIDRITTTDQDLRMPPSDAGERLSDRQIELIQRWIDQGAAYTRHWAFEPIRRPHVPAGFESVEARRWIRNPIDAFVLRKLMENGIKPSPQATRETLIRRVSWLRLTPLRPTPTPMPMKCCSIARLTTTTLANVGDGTGSIKLATPIPTAIPMTTNDRCGHIVIG